MTIPVGFCQVNFIFTGASLPHGAQLTLGVDNSAVSADPAVIAADFEGYWITSGLSANLSTGSDLTSILVKCGPDATGPSAVEPANIVGTGGTAGVPNTAFLVQKQTALGGKAGRGRWYLPGVPEASVSQGGALTGGIATAIQSDLDSFQATYEGPGYIGVVLHEPGSPLSTPTPITSFAISTTVATQRRRLRP